MDELQLIVWIRFCDFRRRLKSMVELCHGNKGKTPLIHIYNSFLSSFCFDFLGESQPKNSEEKKINLLPLSIITSRRTDASFS